MRTITEAYFDHTRIAGTVKLVRERDGYTVITVYRSKETGKPVVRITDLFNRRARVTDKATAMPLFNLQCKFLGASPLRTALAA